VKFLIDAHLPPSLRPIIESAGHEVMHTSELPEGNSTPDARIAFLCAGDDWVVVTKDSDFYYSHLLNGRPRKLLLVRTGNLRLRQTREIFGRHFTSILEAFREHDLVELHADHIRH